MKFSRSIISHIVLLVIIHGTQLAMKNENQQQQGVNQDNSSPTLLKTIKKIIKNDENKKDIFLPNCAKDFLFDFKNNIQKNNQKLKVELSASLWEKINMVLLGKGPSNKKLIDQSTKLYFEGCGDDQKTKSKITILDVLYSITYIETLTSMNVESFEKNSNVKYENKNIDGEFNNLKEFMLNRDEHGAIEEVNKFFTEQKNTIKPIISIFEKAPSIISFNDLEGILKRIVCLGGVGVIFFLAISELAKQKLAEKIINYLDIRNIYIRSGFSLLGVIVGVEMASRWLCSSVCSKIERLMTNTDIDGWINKYESINNNIKNLAKIHAAKIE